MYGNASLLRSSSLTDCTSLRASGPHTPMQHSPEVRSWSATLPSGGRLRRIHARSCLPTAPPVTTQKQSPVHLVCRLLLEKKKILVSVLSPRRSSSNDSASARRHTRQLALPLPLAPASTI